MDAPRSSIFEYKTFDHENCLQKSRSRSIEIGELGLSPVKLTFKVEQCEYGALEIDWRGNTPPTRRSLQKTTDLLQAINFPPQFTAPPRDKPGPANAQGGPSTGHYTASASYTHPNQYRIQLWCKFLTYLGNMDFRSDRMAEVKEKGLRRTCNSGRLAGSIEHSTSPRLPQKNLKPRGSCLRGCCGRIEARAWPAEIGDFISSCPDKVRSHISRFAGGTHEVPVEVEARLGRNHFHVKDVEFVKPQGECCMFGVVDVIEGEFGTGRYEHRVYMDLQTQTLLLSGSLLANLTIRAVDGGLIVHVSSCWIRMATGWRIDCGMAGSSALSSAYDLARGSAGSGAQLWMVREPGSHFRRFRERGRINDVDISREEATPDVGGRGGSPLSLGP
ncbi:hypothetical protein FIBSPDRAFT_928818 [Athelia psychrophila]|uniref:Uncharacterized protein n=1 Tax=Athelia psychrophila TaxID=1759441 RepID=A0A166PHK2_9AGAM|nr:hypothetical protein FIBSPDRAFT_928818 [Fibularhizoctonia sp. CBS 109695]